jgi:cell division protein FtsB
LRFWRYMNAKYLVCLLIFVASMVLFTLFGSRGLIQVYQLKVEKERILKSNARLQEENQKISEQIRKLKTSKEEIEKVAREEFGFVRKNEIVYQFER